MAVSAALLDKMEIIKSGFVSLYHDKPKLISALLSFGVVYGLFKLKYIYQSKLLEFTLTKENINKRIILITGCSSGVGKALALSLNKYGFTVIATCRRDISINEYLNNKHFIQNGSTCLKLDITSNDDIINVKNEINKILDNSDKILWGIINNAGFANFFLFECMDINSIKREIDINVFGGINVCHNLIPLLFGRQQKLKYNTGANGGRILFTSSFSAKLRGGSAVYAGTKAGISHFCHCLRNELSPRFGIWCSPFEIGAFKTNLSRKDNVTNKVIKSWENSKNKDNIDSKYNGNMEIDVFKEGLEFIDKMQYETFDVIINDVIHCLTMKYPSRTYYSGINNIIKNISNIVNGYDLEYMFFRSTIQKKYFK